MLERPTNRHADETPVVAPSNEKHVYAVTRHDDEVSHDGSRVRDFGGGPLYRVEAGPLRAVVSEATDATPSDKMHRHVWRELGERQSVVPMREDCIVGDLEALRRALLDSRNDFLEEFDRVGESVEIRFEIRWDVPNVFERLERRHSELGEAAADLRDDTRGAPKRRELSDLYQSALDDRREMYADQTEAALGEWTEDIEWMACRGERTMVSAACLVARDHINQFEIDIFEFADQFDSEFRFDYTKPLPPSRFVQVEFDDS